MRHALVAPEAHEAIAHGRHVHVHLAALRAGALALLAAAMLSASRVDLGPLFFVMAGSAISTANAPHRRKPTTIKAANALNPV